MKKKVLLGLLAFALAVVPLAAQNMSISGNATSGTVSYSNSYWGGSETWIDGSITITCTAAAAASNPSFTVDLAPRSDVVSGSCERNANWRHYDTSGGNESIYINNSEVYKNQYHSTNSDVIKMWDASGVGDTSVTSSNVFTGQFSSGSLSKTFTFSAVFWHDSTLDAGFYELPITFRLRNEAFAANSAPTTNPVSTITIVLRFYVGTAATIFFTSGNTSAYNGVEIFALPFDEVTALTPKEFTIHIQSNFRFYLSVKSGNGGYLRHERYNDTTSPVKEQIPYTLNIAGTTIPLSSGTYKFSKRQSSTGFGTNSKDYSAILTLGDITSYSAGTYSDTLSFTVTSY